MKATPVKNDNGKFGWEISALVYTYAAILFIGIIFIYISFRASMLISDASINHRTYFETHMAAVIFEIVIWVIIARAAIRLKAYSRSIIQSDDGKALDFIANALLLSFVYAIIFSMATTIKTLFVNTPYLNGMTVAVNHIPLAVILISSCCLLIGTAKINRISDVKFSNLPRKVLYSSLGFYFVAVAMYARYFYHVAPNLIDDDGLHHFVLSPGSLLVNYVLPYSVVWLLGLLACLNLAHYANNVEGKIYQRLFRDLYLGISMSFIGTYLIQLFNSSNLSANKFGIGLVVLIGLLLLLIKGCLLVYRGASQLYQLEK